MHGLSTYAIVMLLAGAYFFRSMIGGREFVDVGEGWEWVMRLVILFAVGVVSGSCFGLAARAIVDWIGVGPLSVDAAAVVVTGLLCSFWLAKAAERTFGR